MNLDNLPVEWSVSQLTKMIASEGLISDGDWIESKDQDEKGDIRLIQLADIGDGDFRDKSNRYMNQDAFDRLNCVELKANDVLIARMPDPLGRACIFLKLPYKCVTVVDVCLIRTGERSAISPKLLKYWINSTQIRNLIALNATGTTRKRITRKKLESFDFPVPPLAEQQEIVRQLDVMLAQVEQIKARLDAIPTILKKFRQSVLADAVSGKLTEEWREQNNLPLANIEKLERVVDSSFYGPRFSKDDYTDDLQNGIPTIRTTDMSDGKIIVTPTTPRIIVPPEKIEQFKVKPSDLLITRTGSIGVMALVREEYLAIPSAYLIRFRFKQNLVSSDYIYYALTSPNGQNQMGLSTTAITQPNINANSIRALEIYLPSIEEQKEIVKRVDTLFGYAARIEETIQSAQKRLNLLTQSILAKAFSGELTAEWREQHQELITGINSAESLLAKIQEEREASKPVKKTRKKKEA